LAEKGSTCLGGDESSNHQIVDALENLEHPHVESVLRETEDGSDRLYRGPRAEPTEEQAERVDQADRLISVLSLHLEELGRSITYLAEVRWERPHIKTN
jgi:hypothetical protein